MSNMSYCRFENTYGDLQDCLEALLNDEELSESEAKYRDMLIKMCVDIALDYGHTVGCEVEAA